MVVIPLLAAPAAMTVATRVERRLGPSAAGWVAALPIGGALGLVAVALDAGTATAGRLALSAASHVGVQVVYALVFAHVLVRQGLVRGLAAAVATYCCGSVLVALVPAPAALALAAVALAAGPGLMPRGRPQLGPPRRWTTTAISSASCTAVVGISLWVNHFAGPQVGGAAAAFPTVSMTLAIVVVRAHGRAAGAHALVGLVRSLPCYLAFCWVVAVTTSSLGLAAVPAGLLAALAVAAVTWRHVPLAARGPAPLEPVAQH